MCAFVCVFLFSVKNCREKIDAELQLKHICCVGNRCGRGKRRCNFPSCSIFFFILTFASTAVRFECQFVRTAEKIQKNTRCTWLNWKTRQPQTEAARISKRHKANAHSIRTQSSSADGCSRANEYEEEEEVLATATTNVENISRSFAWSTSRKTRKQRKANERNEKMKNDKKKEKKNNENVRAFRSYFSCIAFLSIFSMIWLLLLLLCASLVHSIRFSPIRQFDRIATEGWVLHGMCILSIAKSSQRRRRNVVAFPPSVDAIRKKKTKKIHTTSVGKMMRTKMRDDVKNDVDVEKEWLRWRWRCQTKWIKRE